MTDVNKTIAELQQLKTYIHNYIDPSDSLTTIDDALELLKEQEAKPPAIMQDIEGIWSTCSMCGHKLRPILAMKIDTYFPKFCSECGQAVKWE